MHTFINCFPICHHLFDVAQYVFDLAYVIYSKLYVIHRSFDYIENMFLLIYLPTIGVSVKSQFVTTFFMLLHCIHTFLYAWKMGCPLWTPAADWLAGGQTFPLSESSLNLVTMPKCIIYSYSAITSSNAQGAPPLYSFLSDPYETWSQYLKAKIGNQVNWHSWITTLELFNILSILVLQGNRHVMFGCVWINFTWFNYTHQNEHP